MFGRDKAAAPAPQDAPVAPERAGAKNRPTPKRRAQEAARKQPLVVTDRKAARAADRRKRSEAMRATRAAMATGDDRHLPPRDKGPVRRYVRDLVDSRWNIAEILLPFMVLVVLLQFFRTTWGLYVFFGVYLLIFVAIIDQFIAWRRIKKKVLARFGTETSTRGLALYGVMRAMQLRRTRLPKPMVKHGQEPA